MKHGRRAGSRIPEPPSPSLAPPSGLERRLAIGLLGLLGAACSCADEGGASDGPSPEVVAARDLAAEYSLVGEAWGEAQATMAPIVARPDAAGEDLLRAANAFLAQDKAAEAAPLIERAGKVLPAEDPTLAWCRFRRARIDFENEEAAAQLRIVHRVRPNDVPATLALSVVLEDLGQLDEARRLCEVILELPPEVAAAWRVLAVYRYGRMLSALGQDAERWFDEYKYWTEERGLSSPGEPAHQAGTLGELPPHTPTALERAAPVAPAVTLAPEALAGAPGGGASPFHPTRGTIEPRTSRRLEEVFEWVPSPASVLAWGPEGLQLFAPDGASGWAARALRSSPVLHAVGFDRMNAGAQPKDLAEPDPGDTRLDVLYLAEDALWLHENGEQGWAEEPVRLLAVPGLTAASRIVPVDYDHDGDLDVLCTTAGGPRLLRNDGLDASLEALTDASDRLPVPATAAAVAVEDVDSDSDVDFLMLPPGKPLVLASNLRGENFEDASAALPVDRAGTHVVCADFDGDARPDLAVFGERLVLHLRTPLAGWREAALAWDLPEAPRGAPVVVDWDLDGSLDLLWPSATHAAVGLLAPGQPNGGLAVRLGEALDAPRAEAATLAVHDLDGDRDLDLVLTDGRGARVLRAGGGPRGIALGLTGHKDNALALGAIVEARLGVRYVRVYWRGGPLLLGTGGAEALDLVRVSWPNGVVQSEVDLPLAAPGSYLLWQRRGLAGSCPFLYTWNGSTYVYVSDVLGITPLGLPMAPGQLVPPDHDEYVLVKGEQLVPRDGVYELQFTEELREVTYLDRVRLDVVDHPADVEVFPNERFSFPPFPEPHTHTVRAPLRPLAAVDGEGRDWTAELTYDDESLAVPFTPVRGQFQGLATPHTLELAFDPAAVRAAPRMRLLLNGWLFWTDASVNVAAARHPEQAFVPPILQVPDGAGGWRDAGPPIGFPADKLKTMVVDVTELVDREDPRLRLFSTLRLYWDSIRLAVDADDAPLLVTSLEPRSARLWSRGFSKPIPTHGEHELDWFDWDVLEEEPRWNQHPGLYTRFGETLPLVTAIDDRFVVMGAGDALTVRFDASELPPLRSGWRRDYLVFLDGWAKDRDPNTLEALNVEPLPFHGMSAYPYGPDESFPDDQLHRDWRRDWQTRPARRWIPPVVPQQRAPVAAARAGVTEASAAPAARGGARALPATHDQSQAGE